MSTQLKIIIAAQDLASKEFAKVGQAAQAAKKSGEGIGADLKGLVKAEREFHHLLVAAEAIPALFSVAQSSVDLLSATFGQHAGEVDKSVGAQQRFVDSLKSIPVVGDVGAKLGMGIADGVDKLFGRTTLSEQQAEMTSHQKALADFAKSLPKIDAEFAKSNFAVSLLGLSPSEKDVAKAKQDYHTAVDAILAEKAVAMAALLENGREMDEQKDRLLHHQVHLGGGTDVAGDDAVAKDAAAQIKALQMAKDVARSRIAEVDQVVNNFARIRDAAEADANGRRLNADRAFANEQLSIIRGASQDLADANADVQSKLLAGDNRGYESRMVAMNAANEKRMAEIRSGKDAEIAALEEKRTSLQPGVILGNQTDIGQANAIDATITKLREATTAQLALANQGNAAATHAEKENALRESGLAILKLQADAGSFLAQSQLDRLSATRDQDTLEKQLLANSRDALATDAERATAKKQLADLAGGKSFAIDQGVEAQRVALLREAASLGDAGADYEVKRLEANKQNLATEIALKQLRDNGDTSQFIAANEQLEQLEKLKTLQAGEGVKDGALFLLQQEANLGDKNAERQLKKIELEKEFGAERAKLIAMSKADGLSDQQRIDARKELAALDVVQKKAIDRIGATPQAGLAQLEQGNYLSGVGARAGQERDPTLDAMKENTAATKTMGELFEKYASALVAFVSEPKKRIFR